MHDVGRETSYHVKDLQRLQELFQQEGGQAEHAAHALDYQPPFEPAPSDDIAIMVEAADGGGGDGGANNDAD